MGTDLVPGVGVRIAIIANTVGLPEPHSARGRGTNLIRKQKGFSLIELLIVVAIILIIAAIAIPNLLRARIAANESSSVSSIRTINTAEVTYLTAYPTVGYSPICLALGRALACLLARQADRQHGCLLA